MKTRTITLTIIFFLAITFSCERERINPWDDKANLDPSAWAPQNLQIEDVTPVEKNSPGPTMMKILKALNSTAKKATNPG